MDILTVLIAIVIVAILIVAIVISYFRKLTVGPAIRERTPGRPLFILVPDEVLMRVIRWRGEPEIVHGTKYFLWVPFLNSISTMPYEDIEIIGIDDEVVVQGNINMRLSWEAQVEIDTSTPGQLRTAFRLFSSANDLNQLVLRVRERVLDDLDHALASVCARYTLQDVLTLNVEFLDAVEELMDRRLRPVGLRLKLFSVTDKVDLSGISEQQREIERAEEEARLAGRRAVAQVAIEKSQEKSNLARIGREKAETEAQVEVGRLRALARAQSVLSLLRQGDEGERAVSMMFRLELARAFGGVVPKTNLNLLGTTGEFQQFAQQFLDMFTDDSGS